MVQARWLISFFVLGVLCAVSVSAGTIVWNFDGPGTQLPAGVVDGDEVDSWRQNPGAADLGLGAFTLESGKLIQTYDSLAEGALPYDGTEGGIHGTGIQVGNFGFDWNGTGVALNLADVVTNYPYFIVGGKFGWSTDTTIGGVFYCVFDGAPWFANNLTFSTITTNVQGRHVVDMTAITPRQGAYAGELDAILWDVYALWFSGLVSPSEMATQWPAEFDNDPQVTYSSIDWIALTDDADFRSDYVPVSISLFELQ